MDDTRILEALHTDRTSGNEHFYATITLVLLLLKHQDSRHPFATRTMDGPHVLAQFATFCPWKFSTDQFTIYLDDVLRDQAR